MGDREGSRNPLTPTLSLTLHNLLWKSRFVSYLPTGTLSTPSATNVDSRKPAPYIAFARLVTHIPIYILNIFLNIYKLKNAGHSPSLDFPIKSPAFSMCYRYVCHKHRKPLYDGASQLSTLVALGVDRVSVGT